MEIVRLEWQGSVAVLQIQHPPINSLNDDLAEQLGIGLRTLQQQPKTKALLIVSGIEKVFAVSSIEPQQPVSGRFIEMLQTLSSMPIPKIAAINGLATGAGFELALSCDLRLATSKAKFGFPDRMFPSKLGAALLSDLLGRAKAKEMIWVGQLMNASEALTVGLINRLIPENQLMSEALGMAHTIIAQNRLVDI